MDSNFIRPAEVDLLLGAPTKARCQMGWMPAVSFPELIGMMVNADLDRWQRRQ